MLSSHQRAAARRYRGAQAASLRIMLAALVIMLALSLNPALASAEDDLLFRGRVEIHNGPVRLQRPGTPTLQSVDQSTGAAAAKKPAVKALIDFGDFTFDKPGRTEAPKMDDTMDGITPTPLRASAEQLNVSEDEGELLIAWEEWHKRVSKAFYEIWARSGATLGRAQTQIYIDRDHHISFSIGDVTVYMPRNTDPDLSLASFGPRLQYEFKQDIMDTIHQLEGSPVLTFPEKSRRREVTISPYFERQLGGEDHYDWKTGDFERVPVHN